MKTQEAHELAVKIAAGVQVIWWWVICSTIDDIVAPKLFGNATLELIPGALQLRHVVNSALLFGINLPHVVEVGGLAVILLLIISGLASELQKNKPSKQYITALTLILAGGLSNWFQRATDGFVNDWIEIVGLSVLNTADIAICIGIVLVILAGIRRGN